jgi:hypothetical protein
MILRQLVLVLLAAVLAGCQTPAQREAAEHFARPEDAQKVAQLSHEAYRFAWDASYWANSDLRYASFKPSVLDWETVDFLNRICHQVPWVARKIEEHPEAPRSASRRAFLNLQLEARVLKQRYHPASFRDTTVRMIDQLILRLDEIASYYEAPEPGKQAGNPSQ